MILKGLTPEQWFTFTLFEQMANVGSDVERIIQWKDRNKEYSQNALRRALELLDLTIADPKNRVNALKELCHVREALVDYFMHDNEYGSDEPFGKPIFMGLLIYWGHN